MENLAIEVKTKCNGKDSLASNQSTLSYLKKKASNKNANLSLKFDQMQLPQRRGSVAQNQDTPILEAFKTPNIMKKIIFQSISTVNNKSIMSKNQTVLEQLIDELKLGNKKLHKDTSQRRRNISTDEVNFLQTRQSVIKKKYKSDLKDENKRDCIKIMNLLKMIPEFRKFTSLNCITDEAIIKASDYLVYIQTKVGNYLFNEGDEPDGFYIILSGTVDITKRSDNITKINMKYRDSGHTIEQVVAKPEFLKPRKQKLSFFHSFRNFYTTASVQRFLQLEEKLLTLGPGSCFGDWGLIDGEKRQANAVSSSECHLVKINKSIFELNFKVLILYVKLIIRNAF